MRINTCVLYMVLILSAVSSCFSKIIDLKPFWDKETPLTNPHKGWYHHYPDNHVNKYIIRRDSDITEFPGMDHIYMRLSWAYLEPEEGKYDWSRIDDMVSKWVPQGYGIAFRITCRETGANRIEQQYATPKWVVDAGAKGGFYLKNKQVGPDGPWEPDFDDPIFLEKLENFTRAFASRYDGKDWLRYVDVGSIGDWGEGHTSSGSGKVYNYAQRKKHVDIYLKYFNKSQIVLSDDFVYCIRDKDEQQKMRDYVVSHGITYRDDSILVDYYIRAYLKTYTVRSPEYFQDVFVNRPTILELQHYSMAKRNGNWTGEPGSTMANLGGGKTGPDFFREAIKILHASYIGYHGLAHEWISENPELTKELLNLCGYWYFPHRIMMPRQLIAGKANSLQIDWENKGVAPAYNHYDLILRLSGPQTIETRQKSGNRDWFAGHIYTRDYPLSVPAGTMPGDYELGFKMYCPQTKRNVKLALKSEIKDSDGFYSLGKITVSDMSPSAMKDDSPVEFPDRGALPAKYKQDIKTWWDEAEKDYYIFGSPCRSGSLVDEIQMNMPRGWFDDIPQDHKNLKRTWSKLTQGGRMDILAMGDSIVNDTMRSGWVSMLKSAYPKADINATVYVRGGGGCQHYKEQGRVQKYVIPRKPDLVLIGGISQQDIESIREVITQLRSDLPDVEILLFTGTFGTTDPRDVSALAKARHSGTGKYGKELKKLAADEECGYLNMTTPWAQYIRTSKLHPHIFYRDAVHANEYGEQILCRIMMNFWEYEENK